jgi:uncharacterized protein YbaP (TraB family)
MKFFRTACASVVVLASLSASAIAGEGDSSSKTFLWEAQRGQTSVYLAGSIHALREDAYPLPAAFDAAFEEADVVMFEINLDDMMKAAVQMMVSGSLEEGRTLEQMVGPEMWFEFKVHCDLLNLDPSFFNRMKPWMAALTLTSMELANNGYLATAGLDSHFSQRADEAGKDRLALETAEFQVSLFADLGPEQSLAFLEYTLADLEVMIPEMEKMYMDWRSGNMTGMEQWLLEGFEEFPDVFQKMVIDRNRAWLPRIVELLEGDRDAMVVVGSMHLVGDEGLVALLKREGSSVTQQ